jgi:hypothetical protein
MGVYRVLYAFVKYILKPIAEFLAHLFLQILLHTILSLLIRAVRHILHGCRGRQVTPLASEEEGGPTTTSLPRECHVEIISILDSVRLSEEAEESSAANAADSSQFEDVPLQSPAHVNPSSSRYDVFIV